MTPPTLAEQFVKGLLASVAVHKTEEKWINSFFPAVERLISDIRTQERERAITIIRTHESKYFQPIDPKSKLLVMAHLETICDALRHPSKSS